MLAVRPSVKARAAIVQAFEAGKRKTLAAMATGTGKTWVFSGLYDDLKDILPGKMLVLAHTEELVDQNIKTLRECNPTLRVDKEMAKHKADPSQADIIVASVASLGRKGTSRVNKYNWDEWDKIVVDEAHHTPVAFYRTILELSGVLRPDSHKMLLGVTATTRRSDGKALNAFYDSISHVYGMRQAIEEGWLVDVRGYRVDTTTSLDGVASEGGDFEKNALGDKVNNPERNTRIVNAWTKLGENRKTVVFAATVAHAQALANQFKLAGHKFEAIWGEDPDREKKIKAHKAGELLGLVNVGILIEGYDDPTISCIIPACPTQSESKFTQMCGRATRLDPRTGNLKEWLENHAAWRTFHPDTKVDCVIIDPVDNTETHTLMNLPSLMGLPPKLDLKGGSAVSALKHLEEIAEKAAKPIDFKDLKSIDVIDSYVEQINMFEVRFPAEVEANSDLRWYKAVDGGYRMSIPGPAINKVGEPIKRGKPGWIAIEQNHLGAWSISGSIKEKPFKGTRATMEEAFVAADAAVKDRAGQLLPLLNRKGTWQDKAIDQNGKQFKLLTTLYPGRVWPSDLTKGQASHWIDQRIGKKGKK